MPSINVTLKENAGVEKLEEAKKSVTDKGGKITHEFSLIKGFTAEFPDDSVQTLETNEHVTVEADSVAKTQRAE